MDKCAVCGLVLGPFEGLEAVVHGGSPHRQYPLFGAYRAFQLFLPNASTDAPRCPQRRNQVGLGWVGVGLGWVTYETQKRPNTEPQGVPEFLD